MNQRAGAALRSFARVGLLSLSIPMLMPSLPTPAEAQSGAGVLERHRERLRGSPAPQAVLEGQVAATSSDAIVTTISPGQWRGILQGDDFVSVRIAGRVLRTRFFEAKSWQRRLASPEQLEGLDVDVVCTPAADGSIVILGLGGGLTDWLGARPGTRVVVEQP